MSYKVVIDPGHYPGDKNKGKNNYYEYAGMWKLSNYLKAELDKQGFIVSLTRNEFENPSLTSRGNKGMKADLFISEHSNAANGNARGVEVYYSVKRLNDKILARDMADNLSWAMNNPNRGAKLRESTEAKGRDYYTVISSAEMAGAKHILLVENGFHDNIVDEKFLLQDNNLRDLAKMQAEVICLYFNVEYITNSSQINKPNAEIPKWQMDGLESLKEAKIIEDEKYWKNKMSDNITIGEFLGVLGKTFKVIKG